ncbi:MULTISPECIES: hypothetical protein [unclassified Lysinibacillus]|uniref:hypothetical protein n=1 Tax=unclassified Lysinibacillus TaxID=2636778 RepID=UPI00217594AD|nr:hypothetical protein [Lysinibacillus sp. A4]MCS5504162.1 hypothetical protein [Lysinibacillus sp. A4]
MKRKLKAVRSLRVANILAQNGHRILRTEPCADNQQLSVFIFEDTPALQLVLSEARRTTN